ncbi:hypothetical protein B0H19DRAFT_158602 [Mycena capillaripes]|nr:hypothetical protein B0H19DRAFT_158602 [Mycena capillaripes]
MAILRGKYDRIKDEKKGWRESSEELEGRIGSLKEKLSNAKAQYRTVKTEKEEIQQTLREMIDLVESLQEEVEENAESVKMMENVSKRLEEAEEARIDLHERCISLEGIIAQLSDKRGRKPVSEMAEAHAKYRDYMKGLHGPENPPPSHPSTLEPVCYHKNNLHGYLAQDPNAKSFLNHILYLPKRIRQAGDLNYIAYAPTHRYERATGTWIEGSDLASFHGGTRELFITSKEFVVYAGTYKCHDLCAVEPEGSGVPGQISTPEIMEAALGVPLPPKAERAKIIGQQYPDGLIRVYATGLQCVGFNIQLYDSLRRRFADDSGKGNPTKRKASSEDLRSGGERKVKKV